MKYTNETQIQNELHNQLLNTTDKHTWRLIQVLMATPFINWDEWLIDEFASLLEGCQVDNFDDLADLQIILGSLNEIGK